jgi:hypothetical protein
LSLATSTTRWPPTRPAPALLIQWATAGSRAPPN